MMVVEIFIVCWLFMTHLSSHISHITIGYIYTNITSFNSTLKKELMKKTYLDLGPAAQKKNSNKCTIEIC